MEGLTRLVSESLARHGFDRPLDYRRLHWSRWFRCESPHSLLFVPSKPGVFAVAEEIMDFDRAPVATPRSPALSAVEGAAPPKQSEAESVSNVSLWNPVSDPVTPGEARLDYAAAPTPRRMLAVTQFFEDDDMAFVLDRMLSRENPMRSRLITGRYFVRFVVIEDQAQRRTICNALNQWMVSAAEKATGIGSHFATSLELTPATEYVPPANDAQQPLFADAPVADAPVSDPPVADARSGRTLLSATAAPPTSAVTRPPSPASVSRLTAPQLDPGAATKLHRPSPFPSGF